MLRELKLVVDAADKEDWRMALHWLPDLKDRLRELVEQQERHQKSLEGDHEQ